jgi:erythromycin esterase
MLLLALFPALGAAQNTPQDSFADPRVAWLRENILPIRSIDPDDEDFTDLEPLRAALDGVRLVLLGEADHQGGSDFLAKTRLVKFLHREFGFDVLVFESPMYDMMVAWDSLRAGMPPDEAFWLGSGTWAGAAQMQPLVAYLGEHARGRRPLEIAGFDHQHQVASAFFFADDLAGFLSVQGVGGPLVDRESPEHGVLQGLAQVRYRYGVAPRPDAPTRQAFLAAIEEALVAVSAMPDERARQWAQILRNLACHTRFVLGHADIGSCNREQQMAENLLWLANERYPDRKVIVWAATVHALRAPESPPFLRDLPWAASYFPSMAQRIGEAFGSKSYAIGVTSYRSADAGIIPDQDLPLPQFEELMAAAGFDYGLLDLRRAAAEGSWAGGEFLARPIGHISGAALWSDMLDGLLFVREFEPRQNAERPAAEIEVEAINEVRERESAAFLGGDADSYVALFTDDCVVRAPSGSRIRGRPALRSWLQGVHDQSAFAGGETESLETIVVAGWALDLYEARRTLAPRAGGEAVDEHYRGLHIYRRQPDGTWRIAQEIWNAVTPRGGT